jgi:acetyl-CoA carboxylase carboxyl transferase alpha subunit
MQEGTSSLMQMAKVSVAVERHRNEAGLPYVALSWDPTYGGVSASYAMQADVRIAVNDDCRIGFAGPQVILNTMCGADQQRFDSECPPDFQSAKFVREHGQLDMIINADKDGPPADVLVAATVGQICALLCPSAAGSAENALPQLAPAAAPVLPSEKKTAAELDYAASRRIDRPQAQDIIRECMDANSFVELVGDGKVGMDACLRGGLASFGGRAVVVLGTFKGHDPSSMQAANYGMPSPHGYRTALRLMEMAQRFKLPLITLVDTVGAWPTFQCEQDGQSEAIATNLTAMAGLRVPIITLLVGEGGSGGALGVGMGNKVGMLSGGYFGVISPEGAASILGRYKDDDHKALQFPKDCARLATAQCIYAPQLVELGVVDEIVWEGQTQETHTSFPVLAGRIRAFLATALSQLSALSPPDLVQQRYDKFRAIGSFSQLDTAARTALVAAANAATSKAPPRAGKPPKPAFPAASGAHTRSVELLLQHLAQETVCGAHSRYRGLTPAGVPEGEPVIDSSALPGPLGQLGEPAVQTAKSVLDAHGPAAMAQWVARTARNRCFVTDTTMRDAHQSLLATRVRTRDIVKGAAIASHALRNAFSLECWGGATFDVCMRFLDECPWQRLRAIRKACPNVCLQMLIRGANAVGYTSYADSTVAEFVRLAAINGMDVFRIFDCFNDIDNMRVTIDAVRKAGKVAEVCLCYTGDVLSDAVYNLDYYTECASKALEAGAHIIAVKDMAGLLKPLEARPLLAAIRSAIKKFTGDEDGCSIPVHFHTHATSAGSIGTALEMAASGCDIIDFATSAMAEGTSQPALNAFCAMMAGHPRDTGIDYLSLEPYDMYWGRVRDLYPIFESGMKAGSARVFEHQIPGGQYSNLIVQTAAMGLRDRWEEMLDMYRDVNAVLGNIVKVTPSSKCVGDLALFLINKGLKAEDILDSAKADKIDFPESAIGLLRGDLGFPHRGFPAEVEKAILKTPALAASKRQQRAGLTIPPTDMAAHLAALQKEFSAPELTEEDGMSSLMYPKVFSDYMQRRAAQGPLLRMLPSSVYMYALRVGQTFPLRVSPPLPLPSVHTARRAATEDGEEDGAFNCSVTLTRVGPLVQKQRTVYFEIRDTAENGKPRVSAQSVRVKDSTGSFEFEGPMAKEGDPNQLPSPMPGVVEKVMVAPGETVPPGAVLAVVSAMKMEVNVTNTSDTPQTVKSVTVAVGDRVVEGALMLTLS